MQSAAGVLWGKKSHDRDLWLPLHVHMTDSAEIAKRLWEQWVPRTLKAQIRRGISTSSEEAEMTDGMARNVFVFLACAHDLGKASPIFQDKQSYSLTETDSQIRNAITAASLPLRDNYTGREETRHALVSHGILTRNGVDDSVAAIAGGHHGFPPDMAQVQSLSGYAPSCGFDSKEWVSVQDALWLESLFVSELSAAWIKTLKISLPASVLLSGLVILSDWIASDTALFPLLPLETFTADSARRADIALETLELPHAWSPETGHEHLYQNRFRIKHPRPIQEAIFNVVATVKRPGIFVIEAPMGEGKTEAALVAAEILTARTGNRGLYFALPSQATSNAMFKRVLEWMRTFECVDGPYGAHLAHGRAEFDETYGALKLSGQVYTDDSDPSAVSVHEWLKGRRKGLLSDFAVGTIDQLLMVGLKQKHLALRHLGFAGKVVVIDECHACDAYMESYLLMALRWLGFYGVPVIVLSATLPRGQRTAVIDAYLNHRGVNKDIDGPLPLAYPLITYTEGSETHSLPVPAENSDRSLSVDMRRLDSDALLSTLETLLRNGGCAGIIVNTVKRAQTLYDAVRGRFGADDVWLLHAAFLGCDRNEKERRLLELLGPPDTAWRPDRLIVIGTQIFEQSMDIDFDVLFTDLSPIDLLLQRIGRLHRHKRDTRPAGLENAACYIMGTDWGAFDRGSEAVYGKYTLMRTRAALPNRVNLPVDVPRLVAEVYEEDSTLAIPDEAAADYAEAHREWEDTTKDRRNCAERFQISKLKDSLVNWLNTPIRDDSEKRAEAAVRDGTDSIEVLVIMRRGAELALLPWILNGKTLPRSAPEEPLAKIIAGCHVRLPAYFGKEWIADKVIDELETAMVKEGIAAAWYKSYWLKGALCLILDDNLEAELCGCRLKYERQTGLAYEKEEG